MKILQPDSTAVEQIIQAALKEDIGSGDITTRLLIPQGLMANMAMVAREPMVACGLEIARRVFASLAPDARFMQYLEDGQKAAPGDILLSVSGPAQALLTAERTALNLVQRMCGVASLTASYVEAVQGTKAVILDTRKTMPGLRELDKYAVRAGGGQNHRMRLDDMVLVKDNHIALCGGVAQAVAKARAGTGRPIEVECDTLEQLDQAIAAKPDRIMLDNMDLEAMREAVKRVNGRIPLEASGNVTLERVRAIAETGVDFISAGRLTHSARSVDIGLDMLLEQGK